MEATGWYEFNLAQAAYEKGIAICVVKPLSAVFAKIDAASIAEVAITACMRKFITMLNAMVRDECVWAY